MKQKNDSSKTHTELRDYNAKIPGSEPQTQSVSLLFQILYPHLSIQMKVKLFGF